MLTTTYPMQAYERFIRTRKGEEPDKTKPAHCVFTADSPTSDPYIAESSWQKSWATLCGRRAKVLMPISFQDQDGMCEQCVEQFRLILAGTRSRPSRYEDQWMGH